MSRNGFVLLEAIATCALVMLTWHVITQCAVQAIVLEQQVEKKANALIAASSAIEKLRAGVYPLKNQTITENSVQIIVSCEQKYLTEMLQVISVKVVQDTQELLCVKTAVLQE